MLRGENISRLVAYNMQQNRVAWERIVSDDFRSYAEPIVINDIIYLLSNRQDGNLESTLFAYDASTGINKFIKEFPRNDNRYMILQILANYNEIFDDHSYILILAQNSINRKIMLVHSENGEIEWNTKLSSFPVLGGVSVHGWTEDETNHITLRGDQDLYTINLKSGEIVAEKRFNNRFKITSWGNNVLQIVDEKATLWNPLANKVWSYIMDSKISAWSRVSQDVDNQLDENNLLMPSLVLGSDNGFINVLNFDGGWLGWNIERWKANVGDTPCRVWIDNSRVFCLTKQDSLFTFDLSSGEKINSIRMDQHNYKEVRGGEANNVMILANNQFIVGIDPLNGDQLWKIKDAEGERQIRSFDNNLIVARSVVEDSIIIINNYNRNGGKLIWSEILDRKNKMKEGGLALNHFSAGILAGLGRQSPNSALFYHITSINDHPYLFTKSAIYEIDISSQHNTNMIETSEVKLNLARAYFVENNIQLAISEYNDLVRHYDQMNTWGHKELSDIYLNSGRNKEAIGSLLNYHNLLLPGSPEEYGTINRLKEITKLSWVHNTYFDENEGSILTDNNKIYQLSNNQIELYRTVSGALLNIIDLDDNIDGILGANVEDENLLMLIVRLRLRELEWGRDKMDMMKDRRENTQFNIISINKGLGEILYNTKLEIPSFHQLRDISIKNNNIFIESFNNDSLYVWNYNISVGSIEWVRSFESSVFYFSVDNRELIFYDDYIVLPLEDKIVFLEFNSGDVINEFVDDEIDEIVICNKNGLLNNRLTIIIESLDYEYITLDLDNNGLVLMRDEFDSENPQMSAIYDECFFEIAPSGYVASYCWEDGDGSIEKKWSVDVDWVPNYLGVHNDNLILLDNENNAVVELNVKSGLENNVFPILWPTSVYDMTNNSIIIKSNKLLYVITI